MTRECKRSEQEDFYFLMITNSSVDRIDVDEVLLNGTVVAKGSVSVSLESEFIEDELTEEPWQKITIEGVMETGFYIPDLDTIETNRYYIEGVSVYQERYGSLNNAIIYNFHAQLFQVKFQDERDKYRRIELPNDNNDKQN